ncbi:hypothetical protein Pfo_007799 [Paulownia fortunei]|nr:hypothetical protein Pfo_007799 [Paulownia fortunei]
MMAEGSTSGGLSKSRSVLGDLTNRIGKRGFSGREKHRIKNFDFNDKDVVKRICVSPSPCTEINSLKGNVISGLSKIPNENRDPNVSGSGSNYVISKNSIDVDADCDGGHCVNGKNVVMGNSKIYGGNKDIEILDLSGGGVVSQSVNELDVDNDCAQIDYSKDDALPRMDKIATQNYIDSNVNSIATEADGCGNLDSLKEKMILGIAEVVNENKCPCLEHSDRKNVVDSTIIGSGEYVVCSSKIYNEENDPNLIDLGRGDAIQSTNIKANGEFGHSFPADTSRTVSESGNDCLHDGKNCDAGEVNLSLEGTQSDINYYHNDVDGHNADNFVVSQSGSIDCTVMPESQESRVFGVDRSAKLKEDECANMSGGTDSIKACSCSFCTKAAYIWLDLNHQDIKARLSAMKKSQKDASILAERSCRIKVTEKHGAESSTRVSKLESHLIYQWRSLFQRTADIWEEEGNQLEASLLPLTDLREKCKTDLELINAKMTEKR